MRAPPGGHLGGVVLFLNLGFPWLDHWCKTDEHSDFFLSISQEEITDPQEKKKQKTVFSDQMVLTCGHHSSESLYFSSAAGASCPFFLFLVPPPPPHALIFSFGIQET